METLVSIVHREFDINTESFVLGAPTPLLLSDIHVLADSIRKHTQPVNPTDYFTTTDWLRVSEATQKRIVKAQQELREANAQAEKEVTAFNPKSLPLGLYKIFWKSDNFGESRSLAAVGMDSNGDRWMAPVNCIEPMSSQASKVYWSNVLRVERVGVSA